MQSEWCVLPLQEKLEKNYDMVAVPYLDKILLFGGRDNTSYNMYSFNQDGCLLHDLSHLAYIPGNMCNGSVVVQDGKLFTVGFRKEWGEWRAQVFDGFQWTWL